MMGRAGSPHTPSSHLPLHWEESRAVTASLTHPSFDLPNTCTLTQACSGIQTTQTHTHTYSHRFSPYINIHITQDLFPTWPAQRVSVHVQS